MLKHHLPSRRRRARPRLRTIPARGSGLWQFLIQSLALAVLACVVANGGLSAASAEAARAEGSSNRAMREEAARAIPFQQLTPQLRNKTWEIVTQPSIYRRMPTQTIECDPDLYLFLLRHPEVVVNIWRLMGITQVTLERPSPHAIKAADGGGTQCMAQVLVSTPETHLIYAEGFYEGPLLKNRVYGSCVLLLRSVYAPSTTGRSAITSCLDVFVKVDNVGVDLLAKTLHPLVGKSADSNFVESASFLGKISKAAEANGPGVQRLAASLAEVDPEVRGKFAELAAAVSHRAALREADPLQLEQPAEAVVQRAIEEGVTPFGQPLEDPLTPAQAGSLEPPRRGIKLRR